MNKLVLLRALERIASLLRRLGLGRVVEAARPLFARRFEVFTAEIHGVRLSGRGPEHLHYLRELGAGREDYAAALFEEACRPGGTVVDVGAHLGYLTLRAARAVGPSGRVVAFEPHPATRAVLEANVRLNGFADRVQVRGEALADEVGRRRFYLSGGGDTSSLHHPGGPVFEVEVEAVTGDVALAPLGRADVVKLDVEGGEPAALRGLTGLLEASRPGPILLVECNPGLLEGAGESVEGLLMWLGGAGFSVSVVDEESRSLRPVAELPAGGWANLYCTRRPGGAVPRG